METISRTLLKDRIKKIREDAGFATAKDFAAELGIPYTRYMTYENKGSEPKIDMLCRMADVLGITIDELIGHDNRFARCKSLVESTETLHVQENEDGTIRVLYAYSSEMIKNMLAMMKPDNRKLFLAHLKAEKYDFPNHNSFCQFVEDINVLFKQTESAKEMWEHLFRGKYTERVWVNEFNKDSCIPLEWWQLKSISSCMYEQLTNPAPEAKTAEYKAKMQEMIDNFFRNRKPPKSPTRSPMGYGELMRDYSSNHKNK